MSVIIPKPAPANTRLTVQMVRDALAWIVNPSDPNDPRFLVFLNECCERLINSGKWKGINSAVTFYYQNYGYIWLPNEYQSVLGMRYKKVPWPTFTQQYTYFEGGPGQLEDTAAFPGVLIDLGDGHPVQYDANDLMDITTLNAWRVYSSAVDDGATVRVFGRNTISPNVTPWTELCDSSGNPGVEITLAAPYATLSLPSGQQLPTVITGFSKPVTVSNVYLKAVDTDSNLYTCGMYEPRDTVPMFRRYQTGTMDNSETTDAVHVICQRRFVPLVANTDWVVPGNMTAIRHGLRCLMYEEANEDTLADKAWSKALSFLDQESRISRGAGRPLVPINLFGDGEAIPIAI